MQEYIKIKKDKMILVPLSNKGIICFFPQMLMIEITLNPTGPKTHLATPS